MFQMQVGTAVGPTVYPHIHVLRVCLASSGAILGWLCIVTAAYTRYLTATNREDRDADRYILLRECVTKSMRSDEVRHRTRGDDL